MKTLPIELSSEEMNRARAGSLNSILRPVEIPSSLKNEDLSESMIIFSDQHGKWLLVTTDGLALSSIECPFDGEDTWLWVQESYASYADCSRKVYRSDLSDELAADVDWQTSDESTKVNSRFSLRINSIEVVFAKDALQGTVQCWSLSIHTYFCGITELPDINDSEYGFNTCAT
jgi:hypothetical protein